MFVKIQSGDAMNGVHAIVVNCNTGNINSNESLSRDESSAHCYSSPYSGLNSICAAGTFPAPGQYVNIGTRNRSGVMVKALTPIVNVTAHE